MRPISSHPPQSAAKSLIARFWRCDSGVNAIEFAFVVPMIIAILLATAQIAVIFIAQSYLEAVAEQAMRIVLTNQANTLDARRNSTRRSAPTSPRCSTATT